MNVTVILPFNSGAFLCHLAFQLDPLIHRGIHGLKTFRDLYWQFCGREMGITLKRKPMKVYQSS